MERISIDAIGLFPSDIGIKHIIVIIDTFTRYVKFFPKSEVTAIAAVDALWQHMCQFTSIELVSDIGSKFVNNLKWHSRTSKQSTHSEYFIRLRVRQKKSRYGVRQIA